jgi:hypothetical protein
VWIFSRAVAPIYETRRRSARSYVKRSIRKVVRTENTPPCIGFHSNPGGRVLLRAGKAAVHLLRRKNAGLRAAGDGSGCTRLCLRVAPIWQDGSDHHRRRKSMGSWKSKVPPTRFCPQRFDGRLLFCADFSRILSHIDHGPEASGFGASLCFFIPPPPHVGECRRCVGNYVGADPSGSIWNPKETARSRCQAVTLSPTWMSINTNQTCVSRNCIAGKRNSPRPSAVAHSREQSGWRAVPLPIH